jgi:hypothetical protein
MHDDCVDIALLGIFDHCLIAQPLDSDAGGLVAIHFDGSGFDTGFVDGVAWVASSCRSRLWSAVDTRM